MAQQIKAKLQSLGSIISSARNGVDNYRIHLVAWVPSYLESSQIWPSPKYVRHWAPCTTSPRSLGAAITPGSAVDVRISRALRCWRPRRCWPRWRCCAYHTAGPYRLPRFPIAISDRFPAKTNKPINENKWERGKDRMVTGRLIHSGASHHLRWWKSAHSPFCQFPLRLVVVHFVVVILTAAAAAALVDLFIILWPISTNSPHDWP